MALVTFWPVFLSPDVRSLKVLQLSGNRIRTIIFPPRFTRVSESDTSYSADEWYFRRECGFGVEFYFFLNKVKKGRPMEPWCHREPWCHDAMSPHFWHSFRVQHAFLLFFQHISTFSLFSGDLSVRWTVCRSWKTWNPLQPHPRRRTTGDGTRMGDRTDWRFASLNQSPVRFLLSLVSSENSDWVFWFSSSSLFSR